MWTALTMPGYIWGTCIWATGACATGVLRAATSITTLSIPRCIWSPCNTRNQVRQRKKENKTNRYRFENKVDSSAGKVCVERLHLLGESGAKARALLARIPNEAKQIQHLRDEKKMRQKYAKSREHW